MATSFLLFAQQTMPTFDGLYWLNLASRILHIVGAIILVGGLFYLRTVVMPSPAAANAKSVDEKFGGLRAKWAMWIGIATALLIVTGTWNLVNTFQTYKLAATYHMLLTLKILAALALSARSPPSSPAAPSPPKSSAKKCGCGSASRSQSACSRSPLEA